MDATTEALRHLDEEQCWERLAGQELGRIVTRLADRVDIFPVNYAVDGRSLVFRTAEGSKLFELTVHDEVLFEVDDHTDLDAWSVVVRGRARVLVIEDEVLAADALPLRPWAPTVKNNYVRIEPTSVSGRAFLRGPEPEREGVPNI
jgi:nitroimidazol reductase NimA-like FMN-containing flavoprotein (pyridoxamine 5'-phosphate oxidase superfamily)